VSLFDPHPPIAPPASYYDRYIQRQIPPPPVGDWADPWDTPQRGLRTDSWRMRLDPQQMRCAQAGYYATVNFVDDQVGRLYQFLVRNQLRNTWILFTSDHGEMLGDHNLFRKCWAYEGSARVPFLLTHVGWRGEPREIVSDDPVGLQDVMPTLLDIAGAPIPESCTGSSLLPVLHGGATPVRDVLHGEHAGQYEYEDGMHYLVSRRYKYVWYSQRPCEHLFDLQEDPGELHDLSREADGEQRLQPWRDRLVRILQDRPEGFVQNGELVRGVQHRHHLPGLQGDRFYPYT
jgi:arylsulfatase A-like enzyme